MSSDYPITLISDSDQFAFLPSLIWVMQGWREPADITFPIKTVLDEAVIEFIHDRLVMIDRHEDAIQLDSGDTVPYDKLLITTGGEGAWDRIPGSMPKPDGHTVSILSIGSAMKARQYWQEFLDDPGPIVIGIALNTSLFGAAYELALNLDTALRNVQKRDDIDITFVTPEPYLGHFGIEGIGDSRALLEKTFHAGIFFMRPRSKLLVSMKIAWLLPRMSILNPDSYC